MEQQEQTTITTHPFAFLQGYKQAILSPDALTALEGANAYRVVSISALMFALAFVLVTYLTQFFPGLAAEAQYIGTFGKTAQDGMVFHFQFFPVFTTGLVRSVIPIIMLSVLFWFIHRIFSKTTLNFAVMLAIVGFCYSIVTLGMLVRFAIDAATGTYAYSLHTGVVSSVYNNYFTFIFLQNFDVFFLWLLVAISYAIGGLLAWQRKNAFIVAAIALCITALAFGSYVLLIKKIVA